MVPTKDVGLNSSKFVCLFLLWMRVLNDAFSPLRVGQMLMKALRKDHEVYLINSQNFFKESKSKPSDLALC